MAQDPVQLLAQADKACSSVGSGFSSWFGSSRTDKFENAAELYIKAGAAYRRQGLGREAGMAYEKAATIQSTKLNEPDDMANTLQDAFKAYKDECPEDAARCLSQAIEHYLQKNNFRRAATQKQVLADYYKLKRDKRARSAYADAAQWYEDDSAYALANKMNLDAAELAALDNDFLDAIKRFEHVARQSVSSNLMRYSVQKYLWQAGLCHLALDVISAQRAFQSYQELDPSFPSTDDGKLLASLLEIAEQGDSDAFEARCFIDFEPGKGLRSQGFTGSWNEKMLARIRNQLQEKEEDFS